MNLRWRYVGMAAIIVTASPAAPAIAAVSCSGPLEIVEARPAAIKAAVLSTGKTVLTFSGYSGAEYEDPAALRAAVVAVLEGHDPARTLVNIGATQVGIGAAYELAKGRGFSTMGIVSSLARDEQVPFAPCVDVVFLVPDTIWGGRWPGTRHLSPTSAAMVDTGAEFVAIGGGEVTRDEMVAARQAGKPVHYVPADMSHAIARRKATAKGMSAPTDFKGAAHSALAGKGQQIPSGRGK